MQSEACANFNVGDVLCWWHDGWYGKYNPKQFYQEHVNAIPRESALYRFNDQTIRSHFSIDSRASRNNEGLEQDGSCPDMQFWD